MPNPVVHFEIMGKDAAATQKFYGEVFGWDINAKNPMNYGTVGAQEGNGIGGGVAANPQAATYVTVYAAVADLQATLDKAEAAGGTTVMFPTEIPGVVTMAMFKDPDGNLIGIIKE
ncbi:MAG TPA: VOC family protein [Acidimicrobiales bacterium]|nr:VOC family protein [Acidimicrobiales bacterium]